MSTFHSNRNEFVLCCVTGRALSLPQALFFLKRNGSGQFCEQPWPFIIEFSSAKIQVTKAEAVKWNRHTFRHKFSKDFEPMHQFLDFWRLCFTQENIKLKRSHDTQEASSLSDSRDTFQGHS